MKCHPPDVTRGFSRSSGYPHTHTHMGNTNWTQWAIKNRHELGRGTCCGRQSGIEGIRQEADRNVFHCTDVQPSQEHRKIEIKLKKGSELRERERDTVSKDDSRPLCSLPWASVAENCTFLVRSPIQPINLEIGFPTDSRFCR